MPPVSPLAELFTPPTGDFLHVSSYDTTGGNRDRLEIAAGDSAVLLDLVGAGVIRRLWITVASRDPHYLRDLALEMYWDGETTPSVLAPLGDFFGNGFDRRHYAALPMGMSSGGFYCYLPMPFRKQARIVIRNGTGLPVDAFYYNIDLVRRDHLPPHTATFHAWWHRDARTTAAAPHLVLAAHGAGQLVGISLNAESYTGDLGFLEGDEIYHVDGEFRGQGTGTEDYFNSGWYFDQGPFAAPFHGLILKDDTLGRIAAYRWHILDPIPFHDSIRVELEHGHANQAVADYATMAYWYQSEPHTPFPPLPPPAERVLGVKIPPGAILADSLTETPLGAGIRVAVPVAIPDRYLVVVYPRAGTAADSLAIVLPGRPPRRFALGAVAAGAVLPPVTLGSLAVTDSLVLALPGAEAGALAAVRLEPVREWAREWSVVGPFPNPQRVGSEYSPALDSVFAPERDPERRTPYTLLDGGSASWHAAEAGEDGRLHLNPLFTPNDWVAAYARTYLFAPTEGTTTLLLGADDAHVLWVNDQRVSERQGRHVSIPDELAIPAHLRAGWNRILVKVADLDGGWALMLRAADPQGQLRWSRRPGRVAPARR